MSELPTTRAGRAPVVVGIDGAGSSGKALDWASAEAAARGCPLYVVHAVRLPRPADPYGIVSPSDGLVTARTAAESVLESAVDRARSVASDVAVSGLLLLGTPARALLAESAGAGLLVLGTRGLWGLRGLLAGSVSVPVTAHAACPVVVVHPRQDEDVPGWAPLRVVVGVDGTPSCTPAVGFAFRAARQRGIPLTAVHAWTRDAEAGGRRTLEGALEPWRSDFADVPVHAALVRGDPAHALLAHSTGAALVVVGSRGRGLLRGTVFGSVGQSVLHHGRSPLAIVRRDGARTTHAPERHRVSLPTSPRTRRRAA